MPFHAEDHQSDITAAPPAWPRRTFLAMSRQAIIGAALSGLASGRDQTRPGLIRGGHLRVATRLDVSRLRAAALRPDHFASPMTGVFTGLTDISQAGDIVPGLAASYDPSDDLRSWVFRLRRGVLFHDGRAVDAKSVELNIRRLQNPNVGSDAANAILRHIESIDRLDAYTLRFHLSQPDAAFPARVLHYPSSLQSPDHFDPASPPVGTGPFKVVSTQGAYETTLARFEPYWETDPDGHPLPYLDSLIGHYKPENESRVSALRGGEVDFIDHLPLAQAASFQARYRDQYTVSPLHLGALFVVFNWNQGPFRDRRLRQAAAHAIDLQTIHNSVFSAQGDPLDQPYPRGSPWRLTQTQPLPYDPDQAASLIRQAGALGTEIVIISGLGRSPRVQCSEVIQQMWNEVGFKVKIEPLYGAQVQQRLIKRDFNAYVTRHPYPADPDHFLGAALHSQSPDSKLLSGWYNARYDHLIEEARAVLNPARRQALYAEAWRIVNRELPIFHLHEWTTMSVAAKSLKQYQPSLASSCTYRAGGIRASYFEA